MEPTERDERYARRLLAREMGVRPSEVDADELAMFLSECPVCGWAGWVEPWAGPLP